MVRLLQLAKRLRDPGGCPWDAEQTHHSLTRYLLEESYEVVEAVENLPDPPGTRALEDELGDLLYQVVFHAVLAEEAGEFTMADVARGIHDKLVRRHPHVFGDVVADETDRRRCATGSRSRRRRRAPRRSSRASRPGCRRSSTPTSCSARRRRSGSTPARSTKRSTASTPRSSACAPATPTSRRDLAQVLAASVIVARAGGVDAESALRGWAARLPPPLRGDGAPRRSSATSTSPRSTRPPSPPSGWKPKPDPERTSQG